MTEAPGGPWTADAASRFPPGRPVTLIDLLRVPLHRFRLVVARKWPLAYTPGKSYEAAMRQVLTTELIGRAELRYLFPEAVIRNERLLGLTKSIIAVRRP